MDAKLKLLYRSRDERNEKNAHGEQPRNYGMSRVGQRFTILTLSGKRYDVRGWKQGNERLISFLR